MFEKGVVVEGGVFLQDALPVITQKLILVLNCYLPQFLLTLSARRCRDCTWCSAQQLLVPVGCFSWPQASSVLIILCLLLFIFPIRSVQNCFSPSLCWGHREVGSGAVYFHYVLFILTESAICPF